MKNETPPVILNCVKRRGCSTKVRSTKAKFNDICPQKANKQKKSLKFGDVEDEDDISVTAQDKLLPGCERNRAINNYKMSLDVPEIQMLNEKTPNLSATAVAATEERSYGVYFPPSKIGQE